MAALNAKLAGRDGRHARDRAIMVSRHLLARGVRDPLVLRGKPIVRGTRVPVYLIVDFVNNGVTPAQIVADYPDLTAEDVAAALAFAAQEQARIEVRRW